MSKSKHTPGPWKTIEDNFLNTRIFSELGHGDLRIVWAEQQGDVAYIVPKHDGDKGNSNAARIVACVNACERINPLAVPKMLAALKKIDSDASDENKYTLGTDLVDEIRDAIKTAEKTDG